MKTHFVFFLLFLVIYIVLLFTHSTDIFSAENVFGESILENKNYQFLIIGICIFIFGKYIIDSSALDSNK